MPMSTIKLPLSSNRRAACSGSDTPRRSSGRAVVGANSFARGGKGDVAGRMNSAPQVGCGTGDRHGTCCKPDRPLPKGSRPLDGPTWLHRFRGVGVHQTPKSLKFAALLLIIAVRPVWAASGDLLDAIEYYDQHLDPTRSPARPSSDAATRSSISCLDCPAQFGKPGFLSQCACARIAGSAPSRAWRTTDRTNLADRS